MPKFPHISDEDLYSIIAFLRSDNPLVQPSDSNPPPIVPSFLTKFLANTAFGPLPYPDEPIVAPDPGDKVAYGKYLATAKFDCYIMIHYQLRFTLSALQLMHYTV